MSPFRLPFRGLQQRLRSMTSKKAILVCNGIALAGGVVFVLCSAMGCCAPLSRAGTVFYCTPLVLLAVAEWLMYRERYGVAVCLMLIGGLGTVPIGLIAIASSFAANRLRLQSRVDHGSDASCVRCGYNLHGTPSPQCPECGWVKSQSCHE
jgi:hypothetical protein